MNKIILRTNEDYERAVPQLLTREFRAMGSNMLVALQTDAPLAHVALAQVPEWFDGWEQQLSRFRSSSELNLLNKNTGRPFGCSAELWEVLQTASAAYSDTDGLGNACRVERGSGRRLLSQLRATAILSAPKQWLGPAS